MKIKKLLPICLVLIFACQTVPLTGRQQLSIIPAGQILSMSATSYGEFLSTHTVVTDAEDAKMVKRVGVRIQRAVEQYFAQNNLSDRLKGYEWEFNLVDDDAVNAWCMPGGKVVVYTGILPVAKDDKGLAVVMGHEIAHAVANHGDERMSQGLIAQMGGMALSTALAKKPKQTSDLFMTAFGIGTQVGVLLPFSRLQESEADRLGLIFMAMAGYDPHEAPEFWKRMSSGKQGAAPPEFLSTHPADQTRISNLEKQMTEAMSYYGKP
ncbi:MAG: M48 family metallopeptidase [Nitrospiraceae bacterium]|nr:MAG: M48 family metallopeptidase [Nitrospiraceae bacterium]